MQRACLTHGAFLSPREFIKKTLEAWVLSFVIETQYLQLWFLNYQIYYKKAVIGQLFDNC
jgi:hypothetical protein